MSEKKFLKTIAIASGKIGVGKTTVAVNLALAMNKLGRKVMLMDSDFGLRTIGERPYLPPKYPIQHLLNRELSLKDILGEDPAGSTILSAGHGPRELKDLTELQRLNILNAIDVFAGDIDVLLIDTASGISENIAFFCSAAQEILILTSPKHASIADSAALITVLYSRYQEKQFHVLVNLAKNDEEALEVFRRLSLATEPCQSISLDYLGNLPLDVAVHAAVQAQRAFVDLYPRCPASRGIIEIGKKILKSRDKVKGTLQFCISQLLTTSADSLR
ncbi:MAG: P-loop NTPase [Nitrospirae bacterium]|nr:P-loop NTPase [Nitrospirota bacterium]